ncbi:MAG: hypothetical protein HQ582_14250 [Planctomycetes bacterium]|nr:hypothetical protein [Planctomycetota bacterium]
MASPFKVFRKNQKLMLAFLGVLVMVGFVILPAIMQTMGQPKQVRSSLAATTAKYGDLHRQQISVLRWQRQTAIRFMESLGRQLVMAEGNPMAIQLAFHYMAPSGNVSPTSDEALVEKWLLVKRAEELGLTVNDDAVEMFIIDLSQRVVSGPQIRELLEAMEIDENNLFSVLRDELLVIRLRRMFNMGLRGAPTPFSLDGLPTATPAQRWDYFQRLNRKVTIESAALSVSDFIKDVAEPDESTLRAFFEEHKDRLPDPTSVEPGFREPEKIAVEYLKAAYEPLFEREVEAVPQEDVAKYYEEHKEDYKQEELPGGAEEEPSPAESEGGVETKADAEAPAGEEKSADEEASTAAEMPAESEAGVETKDDAEAPAEEEASTDEAMSAEEEAAADEEKPADEAKSAESETMDEPAPEAEDSNDSTSALDRASPFRLASFQEGEAEASEEKAAAPDDPATEPGESPAEPPPEEPEKADAASETPAMETSPAETPPAETPPAETPPAETPAADTPPADTPPTDTPPADTPPTEESQEPAPPKYVPLEKVEAEIRRTLAREAVKAKIDDTFNRVQELMRRYRNERLLHATGEGEAPLTEPDLADAFRLLLVDKSGKEEGKVSRDSVADPEGVKLLTRSKTALISAIEAAGLDLGQSRVENRTAFADYAYGENWQAYQPTQSVDSDGNRYVFWKVDDAKERTSEFDFEEVEKLEKQAEKLESRGKGAEAREVAQEAETKRGEVTEVRQRVLRQWKMIQARGQAIAKAEALAEEARQAKKSLAETFADRPDLVVTGSEPFSWVTHGNIPAMWAQGPPSLSKIQGVDMAGDELMREVFGLKEGEIGTAVNQPQTSAYVVRLTDSNPLPDVLWRMFLSESYFGYFRVASQDLSTAEEAWIDGIKSDVGFAWDPEWERQPGR